MSEVAHAEGLWIGGRWESAQQGASFAVTDPATGRVVGEVADADGGDVTRAIDSASSALADWRETPARDRARVLRACADLMRDRSEALAQVMTSEQGKPLAESRGEIEYAAAFFEWFAGEAERVYGQIVPSQNSVDRILVLRQGVGVTVAITPWNFPAAMLTRKLGPALAAGCTAIVKPSSATPLTAIAICRVLQEAGVPDGVVSLITSRNSREFARVVFGDPRVRKVSFTGSTDVGKELIRASADQVKRLSLELGGHAPFVVFDDADVSSAIDGLIACKFRNAGQTCISANRIYVQRGIYDEFLSELTARVGRLRVGNGADEGVTVGPLINAAAVAKAVEHVGDASARGARILLGGEPPTEDSLSDGYFFLPTVIADATANMLISREETFGPVCAVTPFEREADVEHLANDTQYGLAAYFYTRDHSRIMRFAERLDYGIIGANCGLVSAANVPFGGMKESGYGREGGSSGIDEYLETKYLRVGGVSADTI